MAFFERALIVVRGGGDLASGAIFRLHRAGFPVVVLELAAPLVVRRTVAFADAVFSEMRTVEGVTGRLVARCEDVMGVLAADEIPVLVDPEGAALEALRPAVVIDARMEKRNLGTTIGDAPLVIALGPGFNASVDCHAVIETNRGHDLGRVIRQGYAEPDTGEPGRILGKTHTRVLRAPADGYVEPLAEIGDPIAEGQVIARVGDHPIVAAFSGVLRGLIHESVRVTQGLKIGDLDPRAKREHCYTISDKSLSVGGGALEAVLSAPQIRSFLSSQ